MFKLPLILLALTALQANAERRVVCYYESWESYEGFQPEDFDPSLCTHINYAFIGLNYDGNLVVEDDYLDVEEGLFYRISNLKNSNPNLKVLLSVGGAAGGASETFSAVAGDYYKRQALIGSANYFISTYNFDGLDIDWEYPQEWERQNYIDMLREIHDNFSPKGWLVTAAVSATTLPGYDVWQMNNYLDFVNLMTYDFYGGSWSDYTGQNSPLFGSSVESEWERNNLNVAGSINNWLNAGLARDKLVVGLGFYGRSFTLQDPNQHGLHAPIWGDGVNNGAPNYNTICTSYGDWATVWDDEQKTPYKYSGDQWIGYDDADSIGVKIDYIKGQNVGGVMVWPLDGDDVKGWCGEKQALLRKINSNY